MTNQKFSEVQAEIKKLEQIDNSNTDMIDRQETFKEICGNVKDVNTEILFNVMTFWASHYEKMSEKFYKNELECINENKVYQSHIWASSAKDQRTFAKEIREMMTQIIRQQKSEDRIINLNKKMGI
tara:strand:+ start:1031 stop:1408 length:378 start_codon:yes stop_codon:yes gene_type:complete